jgi:4-aminobutyrate aminotransferase
VTKAEVKLDGLASVSEPKLVSDIPGPRTMEIVERDGRVTSPSLPRAYPFAPKRGAGSVVEDVDGNLFLDLNAGIAVTSTGHCHPQVVAAIQEQAATLLHYSASDFFLPIYSEVASRLDQMAPFKDDARSFLTNSGTEAVEAAIKLARYHTGRQNIIAMFKSFHGRTYGSMTLTASKSIYHEGFGPLMPGVVHSWYGDCRHCPLNLTYPECDLATVDYIEDVIIKRLVPANEIAAVIVEPVLGEGGYVVPPPGWLKALRELCDRHGILFVADEVQSGMGRTGKMWAIQHFDVEPDIVIAGKGIASGLPLGAMIAKEKIATWGPGAHGSTYGGSPVSCAAALATFDLLEDGLIANASEVGAFFMNGLRDIQSRHPLIEEVRGLGLMIGIEFPDHETADRVEKEAFRRGLLMLTCGDDAIRISPPLIFRKDQAESAMRVFEEAVAAVEAG